MRKYERSLSLQNLDDETALALCYETLTQLQWHILTADRENIVATTPQKWHSANEKIICRVYAGTLFISSEIMDAQALDMTGINKGNVATFMSAFDKAIHITGSEASERNKNALQVLRENPADAEELQKKTYKIDKPMNLGTGNLYITYTIMVINVMVFLIMASDGAGVFDAINGLVHIRWGSNYTPLTLSGDWWRLLTSIFIHFGVIHLFMNMYCLYSIGVYLEHILGRSRYLTAYVCTGVAGNIVSLWWHTSGVNGAGASGAIFGLYGVFFAMLTSSLIPKSTRQPLLKNIAIFIVYNLVYGMKGNIDNSAHIGGLVSGAIIGYAYIFALKNERNGQAAPRWIIPAIIFITGIPAFGYIQQNKVGVLERTAVKKELEAASYPDYKLFISRLDDFERIHNDINKIIFDSTLSGKDLLNKLHQIVLPELEQAEQVINTTQSYAVSPASHSRAAKLIRYINLRKSEVGILAQITETKNIDSLTAQLDDIRKKADVIFNEATKE